MDKPFASLPIWAVLLIAFGIAVVAHLLIRHSCVEYIVECGDGVKYIKRDFGWKRKSWREFERDCRMDKPLRPEGAKDLTVVKEKTGTDKE